MDLAGQVYLVLELARPSEKARIFVALYRLAYSESHHRNSPNISVVRPVSGRSRLELTSARVTMAPPIPKRARKANLWWP